MNLIQYYFAYGESLATAIPAIGHTPANPRFVRITEMGNPDEFTRATAKELPADGTVLVWEMFSESPGDGQKNNWTSLINGTFVVLRKGTTVEKLAIFDSTRRIGLEVLRKMIADSVEGALATERVLFQLQNGGGEAVGPLSVGWYGYAFSFTWRVPLF